MRLGRCVNVSLIDKLSVVFEALRLWAVLDRISNALNGTFCLVCNVPDGLSHLIGGALSGIRCLFGSAYDSFSCSGRSLLRLFYWIEAFIEEAHRLTFPHLHPGQIVPQKTGTLGAALNMNHINRQFLLFTELRSKLKRRVYRSLKMKERNNPIEFYNADATNADKAVEQAIDYLTRAKDGKVPLNAPQKKLRESLR